MHHCKLQLTQLRHTKSKPAVSTEHPEIPEKCHSTGSERGTLHRRQQPDPNGGPGAFYQHVKSPASCAFGLIRADSWPESTALP